MHRLINLLDLMTVLGWLCFFAAPVFRFFGLDSFTDAQWFLALIGWAVCTYVYMYHLRKSLDKPDDFDDHNNLRNA